MTELSDYRRMVERPMIESFNAEISRLNCIIREMDQCGLSRQAAEVLHPKFVSGEHRAADLKGNSSTVRNKSV